VEAEPSDSELIEVGGSAEIHNGSSVGGSGEGSDANSMDGDPISGLCLFSVGDSLSSYSILASQVYLALI
jgi:hypothetical protein